LIDDIVREPLGGAHKDMQEMTDSVRDALRKHLKDIDGSDRRALIEARYDKFRAIGMYQDTQMETVEKIRVKSEARRGRKKLAGVK